MNDNHDNFEDEEDFGPSKTEVKQQMHALQALGEQLTQLPKKTLSEFTLSEKLTEAIATYHRINSREAKRRQLQYIGKLMRDIDTDAIVAKLEKLAAIQDQHSAVNKLSEQWRERLLENKAETVTEFFNEFTVTEPQALRQLIRGACNAKSEIKKKTASRELFRAVREIITEKLG